MSDVPHSVMVSQIDAAVSAERERCAKVVEEFDDFVYERKTDTDRRQYWVAERLSMAKLANEIRNGRLSADDPCMVDHRG